MAITGIIFNSQKVLINAVSTTSSGFFQNIANVLQGSAQGGYSGIVVDATLSETHENECEVTNYPVETGAAISDHVQLKPKIYTMEGIISDTPISFLILENAVSVVNTFNATFLNKQRSTQVYDSLVLLQASRQPFTVISSLKRYPNMIMKSFTVDRDSDSANEIHFKMTLQQVLLVTSQTSSAQGQNLGQRVQKTAQVTQQQTQQPTTTNVENPTGNDNGLLLDFYGILTGKPVP